MDEGLGPDGPTGVDVAGAALIEEMDEAVITVALDGTVTSWSQGAERLYGYPAAAATGRRVFALLNPGTGPDGFEAFGSLIDRLTAQGRLFETAEHRRVDGTHVLTETSFVFRRDDAGSPIGILGVVRDVTDARREHQRQLDEARLRGLDARMNEIELVVGMDGSIVHANDRALETYGYAHDEIVTLSIHDLRAEPTRNEIEAQMTAAATSGTRFETSHRRRDGSTFPVEVSSRRFEVEGRAYLHSLVRDLTASRAANDRIAATVMDLREAVANVKVLSGLLPICMHCKKIRDDQGYWQRIEAFIATRTDALFSHGLCPECLQEHYAGDLD